jgi:23S rRNA pseudouridine2605 synthase
MRLAKFLADAQIFSRREAERAIVGGLVSVNSSVVRDPALLRIDAERDVVTVRGRRVMCREPTRVWLHHKQRGFLCTEHDPAGRACLLPLLAEQLGRRRLLSVGRLDFDSEGLLLLTNDGALKRFLELPASQFERTYLARLYPAHRVTDDVVQTLRRGVLEFGAIDVAPSLEHNLSRERDSAAQFFTVTLREGKNREVRRAFEHFGIVTQRLIRTRFGPFRLDRLEPGASVEAHPRDVETLSHDASVRAAAAAPQAQLGKFESKKKV